MYLPLFGAILPIDAILLSLETLGECPVPHIEFVLNVFKEAMRVFTCKKAARLRSENMCLAIAVRPFTN